MRITSENIAKVIERLESVAHLIEPDTGLAMREGLINSKCNKHKRKHPCGTTHGLGGWYYISKLGIGNTKNQSYIGFISGADQKAIDLGFKDRGGLQLYLDGFRKLWGGKKGFKLFNSDYAFTHDPKKGLQYQDIINQFKTFYQNVKNLEEITN